MEKIDSESAVQDKIDVPPTSECAFLPASAVTTIPGGIGKEHINEEPRPAAPPTLSPSLIGDAEVDSPSRGQARFQPHLASDESADVEIQKLSSDENIDGGAAEGDPVDEHSVAHGSFGLPDADELQPGDVGATHMQQQAGKSSRKKVNIDARHMAVFEVISSLLNLASGAEVQKKFLADVRLLSELNLFLDRPAVSKLIYTWGHLKETEASSQSSAQSPGKKNKVSGIAVGGTHPELHIPDSWMIYKEEVPGFLGSFLFFLRIFVVFGVTESSDPLQFITIPQIEKGAKILENAIGFPVDISPFVNSRSKGVGFGSSPKVSFITMDTFCKWAASLGVDEALHSFWRQKLSMSLPSTSPSRKPNEAVEDAETLQPPPLKGKKGFSFDVAIVTPVPVQPSVDEKFRTAEEKLLQIASNRAQLLAAWDELQEFSGAPAGLIEVSHVDRWIVQLFPMLDFAPALHRAFRCLQQHRRQQIEQQQKQKEQTRYKSPSNAAETTPHNTNNSLIRKEFGHLLVSVVFYRRL